VKVVDVQPSPSYSSEQGPDLYNKYNTFNRNQGQLVPLPIGPNS